MGQNSIIKLRYYILIKYQDNPDTMASEWAKEVVEAYKVLVFGKPMD